MVGGAVGIVREGGGGPGLALTTAPTMTPIPPLAFDCAGGGGGGGGGGGVHRCIASSVLHAVGMRLRWL